MPKEINDILVKVRKVIHMSKGIVIRNSRNVLLSRSVILADIGLEVERSNVVVKGSIIGGKKCPLVIKDFGVRFKPPRSTLVKI